MTATASVTTSSLPASESLSVSPAVVIEDLSSPASPSIPFSPAPAIPRPSPKPIVTPPPVADLSLTTKILTEYRDSLQNFSQTLNFHKDDYGPQLDQLLSLLTRDYYPLVPQISEFNSQVENTSKLDFTQEQQELAAVISQITAHQATLKDRVGALLDSFADGNNWARLLGAWEIFIRPDYVILLEQVDWLEKLANQALALFGDDAKKRLLSAAELTDFSLDDFLRQYLESETPPDLSHHLKDQLQIFLRPILDALIEENAAQGAARIEQLSQQLGKLKKDKKSLEQVKQDLETKQKDLETAKTSLEENTSSLERKLAHLQQQLKDKANLEKQVFTLDRQLATATEQLHQLETDSAEARFLRQAAADATTQTQRIKAENARLDEQNHLSQQKLRDSAQNYQLLQDKFSQVSATNENLTHEVSALKQKIFLITQGLNAASSAIKPVKNGLSAPGPTNITSAPLSVPNSADNGLPVPDLPSAAVLPSLAPITATPDLPAPFAKLGLARRLLSPDFPLSQRVGEALTFVRLNTSLRSGLAGLQYTLDHQNPPDATSLPPISDDVSSIILPDLPLPSIQAF